MGICQPVQLLAGMPRFWSFIESNPAPVKYAAKLLGLCDDAIRLPLVKITKETQEKVKKALYSAKLLS